MTGAIPQSDALAEAQPAESLDELVLRFISDPLAPQFERDGDAIIAAARAQAQRHAEAEAQGKRPPRAKKAKAGGDVVSPFDIKTTVHTQGVIPVSTPDPSDKTFEDPPPWND